MGTISAWLLALLWQLAAKFPISSPDTWLLIVRIVGCAAFVLAAFLHRANFLFYVTGACLCIDAAGHVVLAMTRGAK